MSNYVTQSAGRSNEGVKDREDATSGYNTGGEEGRIWVWSSRERGKTEDDKEMGQLKSDKDVVCRTWNRRRSLGDLEKRRQRMISFKSNQMTSTLCKRSSDESERWGGGCVPRR